MGKQASVQQASRLQQGPGILQYQGPTTRPSVFCPHAPSRRPGLPSARGRRDQGTAALSHGCTPAGVGGYMQAAGDGESRQDLAQQVHQFAAAGM